MEETVENIDSNEEEIKELEVTNMETAKELEEKTDILSAHRDELRNFFFKCKIEKRKLKDLSKQINDTEKSMTTKEVKIEQIITDEEHITRDIFERFHVDLREDLKRFIELDEELKIKLIYPICTSWKQKVSEEIEIKEYTFVRRFAGFKRLCSTSSK